MAKLQKTRFDAAIVLANRLDRHGRLNAESCNRVDAAVRVVKDGVADVLVCCGWAYGKFRTSVADAMKQRAIEKGDVPASLIFTEPAPRDTVGEAVFTKLNFAVPLSWSGVVLVTSDYHASRSLAIFSFVYGPKVRIEVVSARGGGGVHRSESEAKSLLAFRHTFRGIAPGDDAAIFERLRTEHPFYNGETYPQIDSHR